MKRKPAKTSKSAKSKSVRFNCPMCDPKAKTRPWLVLICLLLLVIGASVLVINGSKRNKGEQRDQGEQVEGWKSYVFEKLKNSSFLGYKVSYPNSWKLDVGNDTLTLKSEKNGSLIKIQQLAIGGAFCDFPDSRDLINSGGPKFKNYFEIKSSWDRVLRRGKFEKVKNPNIEEYTFCLKHKDDNRFEVGTEIGFISYEIVKGNTDSIKQADEIVKRIEILE